MLLEMMKGSGTHLQLALLGIWRAIPHTRIPVARKTKNCQNKAICQSRFIASIVLHFVSNTLRSDKTWKFPNEPIWYCDFIK